MNRTIIMLSVAVVSLVLGYCMGTLKSMVDEKFAFVDSLTAKQDTPRINQLTKGEDFNDFINKFILDSLFQLERIKFPLKSIRSHLDQIDSTAIKKANWKIDRLSFPGNTKPRFTTISIEK